MKVLMVGGTEARRNWKGYVRATRRMSNDTPGCGAVLEVEERPEPDVLEDGTSQHYYVAVRCPECGKYNEPRHVPTPIFERLVDAMKAREGGLRWL